MSKLLLAVLLRLMILRLRGAGAFATTIMKRTRDVAMRATTTAAAANSTAASSASRPSPPPLYLEEGLLAVHKPLTWTSNDVVSYVRGILIRDARERGALGGDDNGGGGGGGGKRRRRRKGPAMKVGHGGTLDPLASGVLVLGVGRGTSMLQSYLEGDKRYVAACHLGFLTDTLDAEGRVVKTAPCGHVSSIEDVEAIAPKFTGRIEQVPPMYSAIRVDGKRLYEIARKDSGKEADVEIPKREVEIYGFEVGSALDAEVIRSGVVDGPAYREKVEALEAEAAAATAEGSENGKDGSREGSDAEGGRDEEGGKNNKKKKKGRGRKNERRGNSKKSPFTEQTVPSILPENDTLELPQFALSVRCGGGTYIRSLVRDVGYELGTVATMTGLVRTKQGPFGLGDALRREDWTAEGMYEAIRRSKEGPAAV